MSTVYSELLRAARRWTRDADEARDLVQTALAEALSRGFEDWEAASVRGWLHGVIRRRAAFEARGAARRRQRERSWHGLAEDAEQPEDPQQPGWAWAPQFLSTLPPSARAVALLSQAGLGAEEARSVLRLTSVAFRQRLSTLRRALATFAEPTLPVSGPEGPGLGTHRAGLLRTLRRQPQWAVASHDPDGHPLIFVARAHGTAPDGN